MKEKKPMIRLAKNRLLSTPSFLRNSDPLVLEDLKVMIKKMPSRWQKKITRLKAYPTFHHLRWGFIQLLTNASWEEGHRVLVSLFPASCAGPNLVLIG